MKRVFDLLFSFFVLLFLSPLFLLIALLIKCTSKGPVFYVSRCPGIGGKIITYHKFRTMRKDADILLEEILQTSPTLAKEWKRYSKLKKDPRVTFFGSLLRKTSLDELPQFFNVLKGDMSIVGPRPFLLRGNQTAYQSEVERLLGRRAEKILSMKPGITGLWQVSGRSNLTYDERLVLEEKYTEKTSFFLDVKIIIKTVQQIFSPKGAY